MYSVCEIISCNGAYEELVENHQDLLKEIDAILEHYVRDLDYKIINDTEENYETDVASVLRQTGWGPLHISPSAAIDAVFSNFKDGIVLIDKKYDWSFELSIIMSDARFAHEYDDCEILVFLKPIEELLGDKFNERVEELDFSQTFLELEAILPLPFKYPVLFLGIGEDIHESNSIITEFNYDHNNDVRFQRYLEFPPELYEAGRGILTYFGTYLDEQYNDQKARVKIEQNPDQRSLKMIIESESGQKEIIEKAYEEYSLIISGQATPEKFRNSEKIILGLRSELRFAWARYEDAKEAKQFAERNLEDMKKLLGQSLQHPKDISIVNQISAEATATAKAAITQNFSLALSGIGELQELVSKNDKDSKVLEEIEKGLQELKESSDKEVTSSSPIMSKFRRILEKVKSGQGSLAEVVKVTKDGYDIFNNVAKQYNTIADWCGLPQVPKVFLKE